MPSCLTGFSQTASSSPFGGQNKAKTATKRRGMCWLTLSKNDCDFLNAFISFLIFISAYIYWGVGMPGAVVRALASHQCDPVLIPGRGVICGHSLLLVLFSAPKGFPVFPSPQKPTLSKFKFDLDTIRAIMWMSTV